jgi:5-methylcytosine-specific restriction endonuclease McrA
MVKRTRKPNGRNLPVWEKTNGHCHLCGERLYDDDWHVDHVDHVIPKADGGTNEDWNLLPSCSFCNGMKKAAKTYRMRRVLMYGRYCLDEATRRASSDTGKTIYELVGKRVKSTNQRAETKPPHVFLWKRTPKKPKRL